MGEGRRGRCTSTACRKSGAHASPFARKRQLPSHGQARPSSLSRTELSHPTDQKKTRDGGDSNVDATALSCDEHSHLTVIVQSTPPPCEEHLKSTLDIHSTSFSLKRHPNATGNANRMSFTRNEHTYARLYVHLTFLSSKGHHMQHPNFVQCLSSA